ncbi:hypothetical protein GEMRC1_000713 [Eukaryota sp. GEM-RC1]
MPYISTRFLSSLNMSFSLLPAETLSCILTDPSFSDQTISFGEESVEVNKTVLAASSTYFHSLWFLEFGDKHDNPIDFSHLPGTSDTFFSFIRSFYGKPFAMTDSNAYHFFYLIHYFQVNKLVDQFENHLNTHLVTWAWLKPFIKETNERNDLRALEFIGPFFSKIDDLLVDDVMEITTEGFKTLVKYCTSTQSLPWFIKSLVSSILSQNFDLNEVSTILNSCSVEALSLQQWKEYLFVPLKHVKELETELMKFSFTRVNDLCVDSLVNENSKLKRLVQDLQKTTTKNQVTPQLRRSRMTSDSSDDSEFETNGIRFSQTRKHSALHVSLDNSRVFVDSSVRGNKYRNIMGEDSLLPGNVYTWKLRYQGHTRNLLVGVIDESKFRLDGGFRENAHCFHNGKYVYGCLSGNKSKWNPGELLEINVNLINYTLTIKSVSNSLINLIGTLPRLSSGNYYPFATLGHSNHVLEIVE